MIKDKIQKLTQSLKIKKGENNKKTIENLVVLVLVIIVTIVAINYIWTGETGDKGKSNSDYNKKLAQELEQEIENPNTETSKTATSSNNIDEKLEDILSNIKGVGKVKVLITYSQTNTVIPMYDEDKSTTSTEETDSNGGTRVTNQETSKKDIIYEETDSGKSPITQSIESAKIEGAIVTAQGASNIEIKTSIIQAVEAVTGLATYKIQVFEMEV